MALQFRRLVINILNSATSHVTVYKITVQSFLSVKNNNKPTGIQKYLLFLYWNSLGSKVEVFNRIIR